MKKGKISLPKKKGKFRLLLSGGGFDKRNQGGCQNGDRRKCRKGFERSRLFFVSAVS